MVVSGGHGLKVNMVEPQPLKFGMDRILSKETSSNSNRIGGKQLFAIVLINKIM